MEARLDLRGLQHAILTCITAGPGLGFNRAVLFLADDERRCLVASMAIGPGTPEEASATWARLERTPLTLEEMLRTPAEGEQSAFQRGLEGVTIPLDGQANGHSALADAYRDRQVVRLHGAEALARLPDSLRGVFQHGDIVCAPLLSKDRAVGLIVADTAFSGAPVEWERIRVLQLLALLAGLAVDNARISERLERQAEELKRALADLEAAQGKLIHRERLAAVGAVAARVSHEIRNPLATIGGFARMLQTRPGDEGRGPQYATIIAGEVAKLETLLREMLDFTSPRPPSLGRVDLNELVRSFTLVHEADLRPAAIRLVLELEPVPRVLADPDQVHRVLLNLWQNAVQALAEAPPESPRILTLATRPHDHFVALALADTGPGIRAADLPRLFTPFFTTRRRGTGLGLAVVQKIVDDHHGRIEVQRSDGGGATFVVCLPCAR